MGHVGRFQHYFVRHMWKFTIFIIAAISFILLLEFGSEHGRTVAMNFAPLIPFTLPLLVLLLGVLMRFAGWVDTSNRSLLADVVDNELACFSGQVVGFAWLLLA